MRILGLDTATEATAVALWDAPAGLALEARDDPPRESRPAHATLLLRLVVELLERGRTSWNELDRIAVGVGPGTFTGLRIGVATARALAQARSIPLVGVSSLHALALGARPVLQAERVEAVLAVNDARRGEAFAAAWSETDLDRAWAKPLVDAQALGPGALQALLTELARPLLAVGQGAVKFRSVLEHSGASVPEDDSDLHTVTAINHCRLGSDVRASASDQVRPAYLRLPDAELARRSTPHR